MRARGLKHLVYLVRARLCKVAPRAGAWIETAHVLADINRPAYVAPRAGAWIETCYCMGGYGVFLVAPRAGAWIETDY